MWNPIIIHEDERFLYRLADPLIEGEKLFLFFVQSFGRNFDFAEYGWFKFSHPLSRNRVYLAQDKNTGRIASAICMLPFRCRLGGNTTMGSLCTGVVTHPDFRRLGLFVSINRLIPEQEMLAGSTVGIGFPNPAALPGHIKASWHVPTRLSFYEKRDIDSAVSTPAPIHRFDESYDDFCAAAVEKFDLCHVKDHKILNWRYRDRPNVHYDCFAPGGKNVEGLMVLKRYRSENVKKIHIVEFLSLNETAAEQLIEIAETYAVGSTLLNILLPDNYCFKEIFLAHGFLPTGEESPVILRSHAGVPLPDTSRPWFVFGDNDVY